MTQKKDTKSKILDAAEELFSKNGIGSTSLRTIIAKADVNIAAIHYHFGSKKEVITAIYARRINPVNQKRLADLNKLNEESENNPVTVKDIVEVFLAPILTCKLKSKKERMRLIGLLGLMHKEPKEVGHITDLFKNVFDQFIGALSVAAPHLSVKELTWRFMFMIGVMATSMTNDHIVRKKIDEPGEDLNYEELLNHAVHFITAGFEAPALN